MNLEILFVIYFVVLKFASAASIYDQSQTGNLNVKIDLKDLQIIALTKNTKEEYVDYDYAYDYSEMTIKPQNGTTTTQKPLNMTSSTSADVLKDNITNTSTVYVETTTESIKSSSEESVTAVDATKITTVTTEKNVQSKTKNTTKKFDLITTASAPLNGTTNNCNRGYVHCDSQQQTKPLSILEMLSQKFKRRENRKN